MLLQIQPLLSTLVAKITIGITLVLRLQTILVGQLRESQFTTHVHQVGVLRTVEKVVFGQGSWTRRHLLLAHHFTITPTKA